MNFQLNIDGKDQVIDFPDGTQPDEILDFLNSQSEPAKPGINWGVGKIAEHPLRALKATAKTAVQSLLGLPADIEKALTPSQPFYSVGGITDQPVQPPTDQPMGQFKPTGVFQQAQEAVTLTPEQSQLIQDSGLSGTVLTAAATMIGQLPYYMAAGAGGDIVAAKALAKIGLPAIKQALPTVFRVLGKNAVPAIRAAIADALGFAGVGAAETVARGAAEGDTAGKIVADALVEAGKGLVIGGTIGTVAKATKGLPGAVRTGASAVAGAGSTLAVGGNLQDAIQMGLMAGIGPITEGVAGSMARRRINAANARIMKDASAASKAAYEKELADIQASMSREEREAVIQEIRDKIAATPVEKPSPMPTLPPEARIAGEPLPPEQANAPTVKMPVITEASQHAINLKKSKFIEQGKTPEEADALTREYFKKLTPEEIAAENSTTEQLHTDPLTGLLNRTGGESRGYVDSKGIMVDTKESTPHGMMMLDIDNFKWGVNEPFGHGAGDDVLQALCDDLKQRLGGLADVMRYGGEEIAVIPLTSGRSGDIIKIVNQVRENLSGREFVTNDGRRFGGVTFSAGWGDKFSTADAHLNTAKEQGRGRTIVEGRMVGNAIRPTINRQSEVQRRAAEKAAAAGGETVPTPEVSPESGRPVDRTVGVDQTPGAGGKPKGSEISRPPEEAFNDAVAQIERERIGQEPTPEEIRAAKTPEELDREQMAAAYAEAEAQPTQPRELTQKEQFQLAKDRHVVSWTKELGDLYSQKNPRFIKQKVGKWLNGQLALLQNGAPESSLDPVTIEWLRAKQAHYDTNPTLRNRFEALTGEPAETQSTDFIRNTFQMTDITRKEAMGKRGEEIMAQQGGEEPVPEFAPESQTGEYSSGRKYKETLPPELPGQTDLFAGTPYEGLSHEQRAIMAERKAMEERAKKGEPDLSGTMFDSEYMGTEQQSLFGGGGSNASAGRKYADLGAEAPRGMESPELLELFSGISAGRFPILKDALSKRMGVTVVGLAKGGNIFLRRDLIKDPVQFENTLAHEIFHIIDAIPDVEIKKSKLLQKIKNTKDAVKELYVKDNNPNLFGEQYRPVSEKEMKAELKEFTHKIAPFDPKADPKYTEYRYSNNELFADVGSQILRNPELVAKEAPLFYETFYNHIENKPEFSSVYQSLQDRIGQGEQAVFEGRLQRIKEGRQKGEEQAREELKKQREARKSTIGFMDWLRKSTMEKGRAIQKVHFILKKLGLTDNETGPYVRYNALPYVITKMQAYLDDIKNDVLSILGDSEENLAHFDAFLQWRRAATERKEIFNPGDIGGERAQRHLDMLKKKVGDEAYKKFEDAAAAYWKIRKERIIPQLTKAQTMSGAWKKYISDNENYATFDPVKMFNEDNAHPGSGPTNMLFGPEIQRGMLGQTKSPFTSTIKNDMALLRLVHQSEAIRSIVEATVEHGGNSKEPLFAYKAEPLKKDARGRFKDASDPNMESVYFLKDSKLQGYAVDKEIADSFKNSHDVWGLFADVMNAINTFQRAVFIKFSGGYLTRNPIRDALGFVQNVKGVGLVKAMRFMAKACPETFNYAFQGKTSAQIKEMMYAGAVSARKRLPTEEMIEKDTELERLQETFTGGDPKMQEARAARMWKMTSDAFEKIGAANDMITKIAGWKYLTEKYPNMSAEEKAFIIRKYIGTPDFMGGGTWRPITNRLFLFSNVNFRGMDASYEAFKEHPGDYSSKFIQYSVVPTIVKWALKAGVATAAIDAMFGTGIGKKIQEEMEKIPEYYLANYHVVPIPPIGGLTPENAHFVALPMEYFHQPVARFMWSILPRRKAGDNGWYWSPGDALGSATSLIPFNSAAVQPLAQVAINWLTYASGHNPTDWNTQQPAISQKNYGAGLQHELPDMATWSLNKLGAGSFVKMNTASDPDAKDWLAKVLKTPILGVPINALIKDTPARGKVETLREQTAPVAVEQKSKSVDIGNRTDKNIKRVGGIDRDSARALYGQLINDGLIDRRAKKFPAFYSDYKLRALKLLGTPESKLTATVPFTKQREAVIEGILDERGLKGDERADEKKRMMKIRKLEKELPQRGVRRGAD